MVLNNPITINAQGSELVLTELDLLVLDRPKAKHVLVKVHPLAKPVVIWRGPEYDNIGDYTQAQLEARLLEVLGSDIQHGLQNLFNIEVL